MHIECILSSPYLIQNVSSAILASLAYKIESFLVMFLANLFGDFFFFYDSVASQRILKSRPAIKVLKEFKKESKLLMWIAFCNEIFSQSFILLNNSNKETLFIVKNRYRMEHRVRYSGNQEIPRRA